MKERTLITLVGGGILLAGVGMIVGSHKIDENLKEGGASPIFISPRSLRTVGYFTALLGVVFLFKKEF